jgi:hypothetical protein
VRRPCRGVAPASIVRRLVLAACALGLAPHAVQAAAPALAATAPAAAGMRDWAAQGGELRIRFNHDLLRQFGVELAPPQDADVHGAVRYPLRDDALAFRADWGTIRGFGAGALTTRAGFTLRGAGRVARVDWFALEAGAADPPTLALRDALGRTWFVAERMMYRLDESGGRLRMPTVDLRIGPALAAFAGDPELAGLVAGDLVLDAGLQARSPVPAVPKSCAAPVWHGSGGRQTDVRLIAMSVQQLRCRRSTDRAPPFDVCDGPGGDDGEVVIAPSALLRNSDEDWTADVPWYEKFLGAFPHRYPPYDNDQHPILVWNLYRLGADGRIVQVGRSGAKHAWFSTNFLCTDPTCSGGHVLGRGCADEYTASSNDLEYYLAPRSEIIPARGIWARCGSTWDDVGAGGGPGCDGVQDYAPPPPPEQGYYQRLVAREADLEPASNPGARWFLEAWYVVRDDIDLFNTMGFVEIAPNWIATAPGSGYWRMDAPPGGAFRNGPALDAWVAPDATGTARSATVATAEGTLRVAVRATPVGARWRYDYAVLNLDFARAVTEGAEPDLRVLDARGIGAFSVPVPAGGGVSALQAFDLDRDPGNDWSGATAGGRVVFTAPAVADSLDWGTLHAFSFESSAAPVAGTVDLAPARSGNPAALAVPSLVPGVPPLFADGFE